MTNKEIDEAFQCIDNIAKLLNEGLVRNMPDGSNDKERMRRYATIAISVKALEMLHFRLDSIRKDPTLHIIDEDE